MAQAYQQIRNEAIQMYRDLPNNLRGQLYNMVVSDPRTPIEVTDQDGGALGVGFFALIQRPTTNPNWKELNNLLGSCVLTGMSNIRAARLYYIFHDALIAIGQVPAVPAPNPPPVPWLGPDQNDQVHAVTGFGPLAAAFWVPPPTPADALLPAPIPPPAPPAPVVLPFMNVPIGSENTITAIGIENGEEMVNFHGERGYGRFYKRSTYDDLVAPKRNPYSQQPIAAANLIRYRAHLVPAAQNANLGQQGGKKRKFAKRKSRRFRRKSTKTRRH